MRPALATACVIVAALGFLRLDAHRTCDDARAETVAALFADRQPPGGLAKRLGELEDSCDDSAVLATVSTVLTTAGYRDEALRLARRATQEDPDGLAGWVALSQALERSDPEASREARRRAKELNPKGAVPRARGAGAVRPGA